MAHDTKVENVQAYVTNAMEIAAQDAAHARKCQAAADDQYERGYWDGRCRALSRMRHSLLHIGLLLADIDASEPGVNPLADGQRMREMQDERDDYLAKAVAMHKRTMLLETRLRQLMVATVEAYNLLVEAGELIPDGVLFDNKPILRTLERYVAMAKGELYAGQESTDAAV